MGTRVYLGGEIVDEKAATVSVFDRGFLYGDSVYEVARTAGGHPVDLPRHLDRLAASAEALALLLPTRPVLEDAIARTLRAAGNPESYVRVVVTRGSGEIGLDLALGERPLLIVIVRPLALPPPCLYEDGVEVAVVERRRNPRRALDPAIKSGNYLNNILALREATARGAYECVMLNADGWIAEGSSSNLFVVHDGSVLTPHVADGLLPGITRRRVLDLAGEIGLRAAEAHLGPGDLGMAEELFLTSSLRGILPITRVDGAPVGGGRPGAATLKLMAAYSGFLARVASGRHP